MMHSPLPDSSALEAGILEDERPSRLSHVQDNVRNLLRTSVFGSVASSPKTPTRPRGLPQHVEPSPLPVHFSAGPEVLPSPASTTSTSPTSTTTSTPSAQHTVPTAAPTLAPTTYRQIIQRMAHQSALFNSRAVDALNHPDLSDPSLEDLRQQKLQHGERRAWPRACQKQKYRVQGTSKFQVLICTLSAVLLAALVATYLALITTASGGVSTTFHVLFILGILLATILFAHSIARLCVLPASRTRHRGKSRSEGWHSGGRSAHHHRRPQHHRRHHRNRHLQADHGPATLSSNAYVPPTPIQVHFATDPAPVPAPSRDAPTTQPENQPSVEPEHPEVWPKEPPVITNPPPAYGRWRGSVRANPDLLHWQAVGHSPVNPSPSTPDLPSPTYDEAMAAAHVAAATLDAAANPPRVPATPVSDGGSERGSPPSYVTRESPGREKREEQKARVVTRESPGREKREEQKARVVTAQVAVPEMVEVRGGVGGEEEGMERS